ncbi:MAG: SDR family oxidoreductase [Planctomycetota bacterium]
MGLLEGKTGLVVGIANDRSYAFHIAKGLTEQGARCAFTCLPGEKNKRRTAKAVEKLGIENPWIEEMDAGDDAQIDAVADKYAEFSDKMDFLVHSIAFADREWLQHGKFHQTPRDSYLSAVNISAYTLLGFCRAFIGPLKASGSASVLAMSYYGAEKVVPGYNVMGVAKSCLESTTRYLAAELGEFGIRVNTISGGYLRTLASSAVGGVDSIEDANKTRAPLRRNVEGQDVGNTAAYLCSHLAAGVTGENIYVDCGVNTIGV